MAAEIVRCKLHGAFEVKHLHWQPFESASCCWQPFALYISLNMSMLGCFSMDVSSCILRGSSA
jgi:hypothetical protein